MARHAVRRQVLMTGAQCGNSARWDLRGGPPARAVPTATDLWLGREFPAVEFERYADDAVIHCVSEYQARKVLAALHERMAEVGLALHPDKTRIVYCKDSNRRGSAEHTSFTFLGFTFRPRSTAPGRKRPGSWPTRQQQSRSTSHTGLGETGRQMTRTARAV